MRYLFQQHSLIMQTRGRSVSMLLNQEAGVKKGGFLLLNKELSEIYW